MFSMIADAVGGLGLFLLGMVVMTDGVHGLAGQAMQRWVRNATRNPATGALTGAAATAVLQSSSATTVAAVGFVSAGLLTFPQALGIIFGANIGTTATGWLVALLGFKLKIGALAYPLALGGGLLRLYGSGKWRKAGMAVAGFGVIFVGIQTMQSGMAGLQGQLTPDVLPDNTWLGRAQLLLLDAAITLVTQSSSAGVAMTITAVSTGTISFHQGAALVVGMDVGTTVTAAMATIGAASSARRTGMSHVTYNCLTGIGAYLLIPAYSNALAHVAPEWMGADAELGLVAFHSLFNLLGVVLIVPAAEPFAALMYRLVPPTERTYAISRQLARNPQTAQVAARGALAQLTIAMIGVSRDALTQRSLPAEPPGAAQGLSDIAEFIFRAERKANNEMPREWTSTLQALDHLQRLVARWRRGQALDDAMFDDRLQDVRQRVIDALSVPPTTSPEKLLAGLETLHNELVQQRHGFRSDVLASARAGELETSRALQLLDAYRWLRRCVHHLHAAGWATLRDRATPIGAAALKSISAG